MNDGIGGNTIHKLASRWPEDVLDQRPDHLFAMIGSNDVWRNFVEPNREEPMRRMYDRYNIAVVESAKRHSLPFIDEQAIFERLLEHQHTR